MEEMHHRMESSPITPSGPVEEKSNFKEYHQLLREEEEDWILNPHNLWLQDGDRNIKFFHRQSKARIWKNKIS
jgi:hypothetical protein